MTEPSVNVSETARQTARTIPITTSSPATAGVSAGLRSLGARQCPSCGAYAPAHTSVCPECGESLQRRAKKIRCLRCGGQASSELTLCPHCGRELRPAPPRFLTWGAPALAAALFGLLLITQWDNGNPLVWAREQLRAGFTVVGERIEPEIVLVVTPLAPDRQAAAGDGPGAASAIESAYRARIALEAAAATSPPAGEGGSVNNASGAAPLIELPTATPTESPTATPEATATPQAVPTDTPVPPNTPEPAPATLDYTVQRGDTLVTIAARHDVDVDELMEANDISESEVFVIQPGQVLVIPLAATPTAELPTPTTEPTAAREPTATPEAATRPRATAAPTATPVQGAVRLDAPLLLSPADGAVVSCELPSALTWRRVPFVRDSDKYVLHLGFVGGRSAGGDEQVIWILAQQRPVTTTAWDLDESLCGLASAQNDHQWRWWVEVVGESDGKQVPVSPPSETWGFTWE